MRPRTYWAALCLLLSLTPYVTAQETQFPYTAHVLADDVYVRSGPGKSYYPTDKLSAGEEVEIYRHDPGGWLAIRPPAGSFSWVSTRFLKPVENGLGEVTGEAVVSRVGSRFSNVRDAIQVRLEQGEKVELIEEQTSQGQSWFKIAPPAGEFRWISASYVTRDIKSSGVSEPRSLTSLASQAELDSAREGDEASNELAAAREIIEQRLAEGAEMQANATEKAMIGERPLSIAEQRLLNQRNASRVQQAGYEEEPSSSRATLAQYKEVLPSRATGLRGRENVARLAPPVAATNSWSASTAAERATALTSKIPAGGLNFAAELATIDLDLGTMISGPPATWNFEELYARTEILESVAGTAIGRGKVRDMQIKIDRLEELRQRNVALANGPQAAPLSARSAALTAGSPSAKSGATAPAASAATTPSSETTLPFLGAAAGSSTAPSEFDGQGILRPVVSKRPDAPRFALVDAAGNVASFVTPAPGLNLQPYVGQNVGMIGTRGFMQELRKPHVMAKRVSLLETTKR